MIEADNSTLADRIALAVLFFAILGIRDWVQHPDNPTRVKEYLFLIVAMLICMVYGIVHDHTSLCLSCSYGRRVCHGGRIPVSLFWPLNDGCRSSVGVRSRRSSGPFFDRLGRPCGIVRRCDMGYCDSCDKGDTTP